MTVRSTINIVNIIISNTALPHPSYLGARQVRPRPTVIRLRRAKRTTIIILGRTRRIRSTTMIHTNR